MTLRRIQLLLTPIALAASACDERPRADVAPSPQTRAAAGVPETKSSPEAGDQADDWPVKPSIELFQKRWEAASKVTLGRAGDEEAIRRAVFEHMAMEAKKSVHGIRWRSEDEVIVVASWYRTSRSSADYYYAVRRAAGGWKVVAKKLIATS